MVDLRVMNTIGVVDADRGIRVVCLLGAVLCAVVSAAAQSATASPTLQRDGGLVWVGNGTLGIADLHGGRFTVALPPMPRSSVAGLAWFSDHRRVAVLRVSPGKRSMLNVVDVRARRVATLPLPAGRLSELAVSADGRIALARTAGTCFTAATRDLRLYVIDASGRLVVRLPILPAAITPAGHRSLWLSELSWSPRGLLSYVLNEHHGNCVHGETRRRIVVEQPHARTPPREVIAFSSDADGYRTAWKRDGSRLGFTYSSVARDVTVVGDLAAAGSDRRTVSLRYAANTVDLRYPGTLVLFKNDDADLSLYRVSLDTAKSKPHLLLQQRFFGRQLQLQIVAVSDNGSRIALEHYPSGVQVIDLRTHNRLRPHLPAHYVALAGFLR
jgi:hypothetical protein